MFTKKVGILSTTGELSEKSLGAPTKRMSIREAWKMSYVPYVELLYRSSQIASGAGSAAGLGFGEKDPQKRIRSILKNAKVSKGVFTLFVCLGTAVPFAEFAINPVPISLVSGIALSLIISFAYLVFYSLQILPSFAGAEPYSLLLSLPFSEEDYSLVTMFSFLRTFDYLAIGSVLVPVGAVALLTRSVGVSALMLGASTINVILAIVVGLWASRLFYRSITRGGRSKGAVLSRIVFLVAWGFAVLSTGFLFNIVTYLLPYVNQVLSGSLSQTFGIVLSIVHPFTFGLAIASLVFPTLLTSSEFGTGATLFSFSYAATVAYFLIAFFAARRTTQIITSISRGLGVTIARVTAKEFSLKLRNPFFAYMMKDLRSASKNPSTAFLFAAPVFETFVIYLALNERGAVNIADVTSMTVIGALFSLMAGVLLLNTEKRGLEYTLSLPLSGNIIVNAKSLISALTYVPVPFAILLLQLPKSGIGISSLIPFIEILAISAATTAEIAVLMSSGRIASGSDSHARRGRSLQSLGFSIISGSNFGQMVKAVLIALVVMAAPIASYFFALSYGEIASVIAMILVAVLEFTTVQAILRLRK